MVSKPFCVFHIFHHLTRDLTTTHTHTKEPVTQQLSSHFNSLNFQPSSSLFFFFLSRNHNHNHFHNHNYNHFFLYISTIPNLSNSSSLLAIPIPVHAIPLRVSSLPPQQIPFFYASSSKKVRAETTPFLVFPCSYQCRRSSLGCHWAPTTSSLGQWTLSRSDDTLVA